METPANLKKQPHQLRNLGYEKASTILTTNRAYKHWPEIFNNDATLTAALLDRLVHHVCTVVIEGRSYRTKDQITPP